MNPSDNPNDQGQEAMTREIDKRRFETDKEINDTLNKIVRKGPKGLTLDDKRFLQARRSYLSRVDFEEFEEVINEKLPRPDGQNEAEEELTRIELDTKARELGIEDPEKLPNKKAVQDAIAEIENK